MFAAISNRRLLVVTAAACYVAVPTAFALLEVPGLGIGHFFYIGIALLALATNARVGAAGGVLATALYAVAVLLTPRVPAADILTVSTAIRGITFVSCGALVGWFASTNRDLVARLRVQATEDFLTGLLNVRAFDAALDARSAETSPFALLVGDADGLQEINKRDGHSAGSTVVRRIGRYLAEADVADVAARLGGDDFGLIVEISSPEAAAGLCRRLERELDELGLPTSWGWALFPADGRPRRLFTRADERMYASKVTRGTVAPVTRLLSTGSYRPET